MEKTPCINCDFMSSAAAILDRDELEVLDSKCAQVEFDKGEIIFKQEAFSSNIIYIKKGLVKVHIKGIHKDQIIKVTKGPAFLGLPTTFADKINQYSATAIDKTIACFIDIYAFKHFIYKNGKFAYEIIINLCKEELDNFHKCVNHKQKQTHGRVADTLLNLSRSVFESNEFISPLTRSEFGDLICTSRESISRILGEFHEDKIINLDGRKIKILDFERLEYISRNG
jgi:CRP/FNR family transcriptional regulator